MGAKSYAGGKTPPAKAKKLGAAQNGFRNEGTRNGS